MTDVTMSWALKEHIRRHGPYHVFKTLLGGPQDFNIRRIVDLRTDETLMTLNKEMDPWTPEMEGLLQAVIDGLNAQFLPKQGSHAS